MGSGEKDMTYWGCKQCKKKFDPPSHFSISPLCFGDYSGIGGTQPRSQGFPSPTGGGEGGAGEKELY